MTRRGMERGVGAGPACDSLREKAPARLRVRLGVLVCLGIIGCAAVPVRPTTPSSTFRIPPLDLSSVDRGTRAQMWTYAPAASTENPMPRDRVTVEVMPVVDGNSAVDSYRQDILAECRTPADVPVYMSAVGFGVRLRIENGTGHIIRMGATPLQTEAVLQIEDGQHHAWPLVQGDWRDWVPRVVEGVHARYARYRDAVGAWEATARASMSGQVFVPAAYAPDYDRYRAEWDSCMSNFMNGNDEARCGTRAEVEALAPAGLEATLRRQVEAQIQTQGAQARARIDALDHDCAAAIQAKAEALTPGMIVTAQTFAQLRILTDQTVVLYVPLDADFAAAGPDVVVLRLYEVVTETNAAGVPTRRTDFPFRLERREQAP